MTFAELSKEQQLDEDQLAWPRLFLNGGITGCVNWQPQFTQFFADSNIILFDPRRDEYDPDEPDIDRQQITWEFEHRAISCAHSFWFTPETLCPITLFELGKSLVEPLGVHVISNAETNSPIVTYDRRLVCIGIDPGYQRKSDIEIQAELCGHCAPIVYSLEDLAQQVKDWLGVGTS